MILLHCKHCAEPITPDDVIHRYSHTGDHSNVHTDVHAGAHPGVPAGAAVVACDESTATGPRAEPDLGRLVADAAAELDEHYTLVWIDRSADGLTPRQIAVLLDGGNECESREFSLLEDAESDMRWDAARQILGDLLDEDHLALLDGANRLDELRHMIEDRDDSGGLVDLQLNASPCALFRYDLDVDVPDYTMTEAQRQATAAAIAHAAGVDLADPDTAATIHELISGAPYGGRLCVLWSDHPTEALALAEPVGCDQQGRELTEPCGTVTFTDAHLLILDRWNGSGHDVAVPAITAQWAPRRVSIDAPHVGHGYSWHEIAGPVVSAYAGTVTLHRPPRVCRDTERAG